MKRLTILLMLAGLFLAGCSGVILNAEYSRLLDETAAWTSEVSRRADANQLTAGAMRDALRYSADHWRLFQDARDGRDPNAR